MRPLHAAACLLALIASSHGRTGNWPSPTITLAPRVGTESPSLDAPFAERFQFHLPVADNFETDLLPFVRLSPKRSQDRLSLELYEVEVGSVPYDVFTSGNRYF